MSPSRYSYNNRNAVGELPLFKLTVSSNIKILNDDNIEIYDSACIVFSISLHTSLDYVLSYIEKWYNFRLEKKPPFIEVILVKTDSSCYMIAKHVYMGLSCTVRAIPNANICYIKPTPQFTASVAMITTYLKLIILEKLVKRFETKNTYPNCLLAKKLFLDFISAKYYMYGLYGETNFLPGYTIVIWTKTTEGKINVVGMSKRFDHEITEKWTADLIGLNHEQNADNRANIFGLERMPMYMPMHLPMHVPIPILGAFIPDNKSAFDKYNGKYP